MKLNTLSAIALLFGGLLYAGFGYANPPKRAMLIQKVPIKH